MAERKDLTRGKLNIAGENHPESGLRRKDEKAYAAERTGGEYWTAHPKDGVGS